jgi:O-antigen ligase
MTEAGLTLSEDLAAPDFEADAGERASLTFKPAAPNLWQRLVLSLEYWRAALAYILVVLTPVVAYVGNLGFAALAALLGIGALVFVGRKSTPVFGVAVLSGLLAWALFSMSWSPAMPIHPDFHRYKTIEPLTGVKLVFELGFYGAFVIAMRKVSDQTAARASLILAAGLCALAVLLVVESLDGAVLYQWIKHAAHQKTRPDLATRNVARACYVATVLFWPVVLRLRQAHWPLLVALFVGGLCVSAAVFKVDAPIFALILGALVFGAVRVFGRRMIWVLLVGTVVYFAAAPLVADFGTRLFHEHELPGAIGKQSWAVRLDIWRFASAEILHNPLVGWGLDASRSWPRDIPLHPHDAALQIWLELGALGAALVALFWAWLFTRIAAMVEEDRNMAAAAAAAATAYLTIGALSFGVWQEWWLAVGAITVVVCGFVTSGRRLDLHFGHDFTALQPLN